MEDLYIVYHTIIRGENHNTKFIGVYSTRELAESAVSRLKVKPGFRKPNGVFSIGAYKLDNDYWADGFGIDDD